MLARNEKSKRRLDENNTLEENIEWTHNIHDRFVDAKAVQRLFILICSDSSTSRWVEHVEECCYLTEFGT